MDYKIESGVPVAESRKGPGVKYPFYDMTVGDSFAFDIEERHRVACAATHAYRRKGIKLVIRKVEEQGQFVGRCWRVK